MKGPPGRPRHRHHGPGAGGLHQRVLCVAAARSLGSDPAGCRADDEDPHHPSGGPRHLRRAPDARRTGGARDYHRPEAGGTAHAPRPAARGESAPVGPHHDAGPHGAARAGSRAAAVHDPRPGPPLVADITYVPTGAGSSISRWCSMRGAGASLAGRWSGICTPSWSWPR
jgi:hypothetical protein